MTDKPRTWLPRLEGAVKVAGLSCLTAAAFLVAVPFGVAAAGAALLAVAYLP